MNKLLVLTVVLALVAVTLSSPITSPDAAADAAPAPAPEARAAGGDGGVEFFPAMLVHEEHIPNEGGAAAADKTLAKFVEELLALRGNKGEKPVLFFDHMSFEYLLTNFQ
jgi:hypothetical protein